MNPKKKLNRHTLDVPIHRFAERFQMDFGFMSSKIDNKIVRSHDGYNCYLLIVDYFTRYLWVFLTKNKSPPIKTVKQFLRTYGNKDGIRIIRTDQGGELAKSGTFQTMLQDSGYSIEVTGADNSSQNAVVERPHQTLANMVRAGLHNAGLSYSFWSDALLHAVYIKNRLPHYAFSHKSSPYERLTGHTPDLSHLRVFGSRIVTKKPGKRSPKLTKHSYSGIFLRFAKTMKNIVYLDTVTKKVKTTTYAKFDEAHFSYSDKPPGAQILMELGMKEDTTVTNVVGLTDTPLRIVKRHSDAIIPTKGTAQSAGFDLFSIESVSIPSQHIGVVDTGITAIFPPDTYGRIASRSGLAVKHAIEVGAGVIDPDYTGSIKLLLHNFGSTVYRIEPGDKIAQLIIEQFKSPSIKIDKTVQPTKRGSNGFGSTDINHKATSQDKLSTPHRIPYEADETATINTACAPLQRSTAHCSQLEPNPNKNVHRRITNIDIHKYLGFCTLKNIKIFQSVAQNNVTFVNAGELPLSHGDMATIQRHKSNKECVQRPKHFFDIAHMDITYGDTVAPGGIKYALVIVDRKTRYNFVQPLKDCKSTSIITALQQLKVMAGKLPRILYTDFDPKLLSKSITEWYNTNNGILLAAPPEQQHQNGLVERTWQTLSKMARSFITDKQMPKSFWFWAIKHASRIHNIFPVKYKNKYTTPHELVFKKRPDYRQLFRLFSTAYFSHTKDNTKSRTNTQAHSMAGIAVGWSDVANGLLIYNPITKELYTTSIYKIDEHQQTQSYFNLPYDGGMFSGLYSKDMKHTSPENYPIGTAVKIPSNTGSQHGYVLAVPTASTSSQIDTDPLYTIKYLTGGTTTVPASAMDSYINRSPDPVQITLPSWLRHDSKVRYTIGNITHQGRLHLGSQNKWFFVVHNKLGSIIKQELLDNLPFTFQTLISEDRLRPGWLNHPHCSAFHVSAKNLANPCPPTLSKALFHQNTDRSTWLESYQQEFHDLKNMDVYDEISTEEYRRIQHRCGKPIPTMCVLTIKYKDGYPDRAKCRIVVLGNRQEQTYAKNEKYAPVITQNQFRYLLSLAIKNKHVLRQGDVKNAFCNGRLPEDETVVIRPPKGCPLSRPNTLWKLKKTLYGLVRSPLHWYNNISEFFKSIGLTNSPNSPCVFSGSLIPGQPPLYVGLYVDDFAFFSNSDAVESRFRTLLNSKYTVSYDDQLEWFLGMKFDWKRTPTSLKCHVHQEAFILDVVDRYKLSNCNTSPRATPFRSGFPVDTIAPSTLTSDAQEPLTKTYQQVIGDLNWLSISTRPDITAIVSLLAAHSQKPSPAHYDAAMHVLRYLASTASIGLYYTSNDMEDFHAFVHFPPEESDALHAYCDANWGPMDASVPKPNSEPREQSIESLRSLSGWFIMNAGAPIAWGCARHKDTAQSSCQAEVHSINETTRLLLEYRLLSRDVGLPIHGPISIKNDNQGAIDWSKGTTNKKMRWVDLRENLVRENVLNKNIQVSHIPGKSNLSDIFTKEFRDVSQFLFLRDLFMISSTEFSTGLPPVGSTWRTTYKDALTKTK